MKLSADDEPIVIKNKKTISEIISDTKSGTPSEKLIV